jgi:hypothetical protein
VKETSETGYCGVETSLSPVPRIEVRVDIQKIALGINRRVRSVASCRTSQTRQGNRWYEYPNLPHIICFALTFSQALRPYPTTCGIDGCAHQHAPVSLIQDDDEDSAEFAAWFTIAATTRRHVSEHHATSLPGRPIHSSDTLSVYGFATAEPYQAIPQDVTDFVQRVQDMVQALPKTKKTFRSFGVLDVSPFLPITFRGFTVWETKTPLPRFPIPLLMFPSCAASGIDTEV